MTRARAWLTLCSVAAAVGSLTVSCGSDEVTGGGTGGKGGGLLGGSAGTSTGGRAGGTGGAATGGTAGATAKSTNLGRACATDATCGPSSGLTCVTDPVVPQGICSATCMANSDCQTLSAGALCNATSGSGLCLEGCAIGSENPSKCHDRPDFACQFLDSVETTKSCTVDEDCGNSAVCNAGACVQIVTACQPTCASDDDCAGDFCNIATGLCQADQPTGKAVGSACDVNATVDECAGMCIGDSAGTFSLCSGLCTFGVLGGCGWNGVGPADAGCMFVPRYIQELGAGDVGYCGQLCDCNADCLNPTAKCLSFAAVELDSFAELYSRKGYCGTPDPTADPPDVVIAEYGAGGADGAGGAGGGAGGAAGSGSSGAPSAGAGAGGTSGAGSAGDSGAGG